VNPGEFAGLLGVVSWKQTIRAAVVVVRANDRGGTILKQYERIWNNYVETEPDWKQHSLNS
jgi:hypothetical protein